MKKNKIVIMIAGVVLLFLGFFMINKPKLGVDPNEKIVLNVGPSCYMELLQFEEKIRIDLNEYESNVECNVVGEYQASVVVKSLLGSEHYEIILEVVDLVKPELSVEDLGSDKTYYVPIKSGVDICKFIDDVRVTATDNYDNEIKVERDKVVNACQPGKQTFSYVATDKSGNQSSVEFEVEILDHPQRYVQYDKLKVYTDVLNVRELPDSDSNKVGEVYQDEVFNIVEQSFDAMNRAWLKIEDDDFTGWIASWYTYDSSIDLDETVKLSEFKVDQIINDNRVLDPYYEFSFDFGVPVVGEMFLVEVNKWFPVLGDAHELETYLYDFTLDYGVLGDQPLLLSLENGGLEIVTSNRIIGYPGYSFEEFMRTNAGKKIEVMIGECFFVPDTYINNFLQCDIDDYRVVQ